MKPVQFSTDELKQFEQFNPYKLREFFVTLAGVFSTPIESKDDPGFQYRVLIEVYEDYFPGMKGKLSETILKKLYNEFKNNPREDGCMHDGDLFITQFPAPPALGGPEQALRDQRGEGPPTWDSDIAFFKEYEMPYLESGEEPEYQP